MYIFQRVRQTKINAYIQIILQPYQRSMKLNSFKTLLNMTTIAKNQNQRKEYLLLLESLLLLSPPLPKQDFRKKIS